MPIPLGRLAPLMALILYVPVAFAVEPVRRVTIYVNPYYRSGLTADERPVVAVGGGFDALLSSDRREDILAARDKVLADPGPVAPMTLMVLAIRLYDMGLRDDAVFWFYVAKDRYVTLSEVVRIKESGLEEVARAVRGFAALAGPVFNGYAFCDPTNQFLLRKRAMDWVEQNPYSAVFTPEWTARPGDRRENLERAVRTVRAGAERDRVFLQVRRNFERFYETRKKDGTDARYCWR